MHPKKTSRAIPPVSWRAAGDEALAGRELCGPHSSFCEAHVCRGYGVPSFPRLLSVPSLLFKNSRCFPGCCLFSCLLQRGAARNPGSYCEEAMRVTSAVRLGAFRPVSGSALAHASAGRPDVGAKTECPANGVTWADARERTDARERADAKSTGGCRKHGRMPENGRVPKVRAGARSTDGCQSKGGCRRHGRMPENGRMPKARTDARTADACRGSPTTACSAKSP